MNPGVAIDYLVPYCYVTFAGMKDKALASAVAKGDIVNVPGGKPLLDSSFLNNYITSVTVVEKGDGQNTFSIVLQDVGGIMYSLAVPGRKIIIEFGFYDQGFTSKVVSRKKIVGVTSGCKADFPDTGAPSITITGKDLSDVLRATGKRTLRRSPAGKKKGVQKTWKQVVEGIFNNYKEVFEQYVIDFPGMNEKIKGELNQINQTDLAFLFDLAHGLQCIFDIRVTPAPALFAGDERLRLTGYFVARSNDGVKIIGNDEMRAYSLAGNVYCMDYMVASENLVSITFTEDVTKAGGGLSSQLIKVDQGDDVDSISFTKVTPAEVIEERNEQKKGGRSKYYQFSDKKAKAYLKDHPEVNPSSIVNLAYSANTAELLNLFFEAVDDKAEKALKKPPPDPVLGPAAGIKGEFKLRRGDPSLSSNQLVAVRGEVYPRFQSAELTPMEAELVSGVKVTSASPAASRGKVQAKKMISAGKDVKAFKLYRVEGVTHRFDRNGLSTSGSLVR